MIISNATQNIIRVLLNERGRTLTIRELASKANVSLGITVKITNALEESGYLEKRRGIKVINWKKLLKAWSYTVSINENRKIEFLASERPQYLIKKINQILIKETYALTLFSATEIISPYVSPNKVHLYILKNDEKKTSDAFLKNSIMLAEEGNIVCYLVDKSYFYNSKEINGVKIISLPQLYVDLFSYGGRGEESAEQIIMLMEYKNV